MTKVYIFCFCLLLGINAQVLAVSQYDEVVSLGIACQAAAQIKYNEIRIRAYPFDWLVTPFDGLISFIINKGAGFLEPGNFCSHGLIRNSNSLLVKDSIYNFSFMHDFEGEDPLFSYAEVKEKYDRRIKRFFNLLESNKKVLFIRVTISKAQAKQLDQVLQKHYPNLSYTIVAVSDKEDAKMDWGLPRVRNFYLIQDWDWMGDDEVWEGILQQFPVKKTN
jgi:hypothetical protein